MLGRGLETPSRSLPKSMGKPLDLPLIVLLVSDYIRELIDTKQWPGLKKAWRVLKIIRASCGSNPFAPNRELGASENFCKSCRLVMRVKSRDNLQALGTSRQL
jgi:hypothetical protein